MNNSLIKIFKPTKKKLLLPVVLIILSIVGSMWPTFDNPVINSCCLIFNLISLPFGNIIDVLRYNDKPMLTPLGVVTVGLFYSIFLYFLICLFFMSSNKNTEMKS